MLFLLKNCIISQQSDITTVYFAGIDSSVTCTWLKSHSYSVYFVFSIFCSPYVCLTDCPSVRYVLVLARVSNKHCLLTFLVWHDISQKVAVDIQSLDIYRDMKDIQSRNYIIVELTIIDIFIHWFFTLNEQFTWEDGSSEYEDERSPDRRAFSVLTAHLHILVRGFAVCGLLKISINALLINSN